MGIFKKFVDIIKANINDLIEKAEDPEKMIRLMIIEMEEAATKATSAVAQAMANEKGLLRKEEKAKKEAESWYEKAAMALKNAREDLAKEALNKKVSYEKQAKEYEQMRLTASKTTGELKDQLDKIKTKLDEARMRQATLIARAQAAKAKKQFAENMGNLDNSAFAKFDKMEEKILNMEAEADALGEITGAATSEDEFEKLENDSKMNDELAKLKQELNM